MASKRIDELDARVVADADLLPVTPSGGPSGSATVAAIVAEGLSQPNSASAGAGASLSIIAADGVTSGAGGNIILEPGAQATTGGNGVVLVRQSGGSQTLSFSHDGTNASITNSKGHIYFKRSAGTNLVLIEDNGTNNTVFKSDRFITFSASISINSAGISIGSNSPIGFTAGAEYNPKDIEIIRKTVGVLGITNGSTSGGSLAYTSSTPAAIVANQNNYVLTGSAFQRLNCTTASDITGIAPPTGGAHVDGRMIRLVSVGTNTVRLMHNDTGSTAANRMFHHNFTNVSLTVNEWADLVYDSTDNGSGAAGWRVVKYA
jgi:hypothetical protein